MTRGVRWWVYAGGMEAKPTDECEHSALICACDKNHPIIDDPAARYRKRLEFRAPAVLEQLERLAGKR